ncbi:hypothetical protein DICVIV_03313 [Dictyocaulus viviparus]|uniref:Uncharacterized protein n=1 Tax=Dictyocaulus viviparus TaxID=29172 RepID=A0A0D8Y103_DICVI|nr:hypothetical protein DICVIV_03313 [Dictyocaulus viviparus]
MIRLIVEQKKATKRKRMDDFNAYRAMCANRLRRLERYKKAKSFCNIDDDEPSVAAVERPSEFPNSAPPCCNEDTVNSEHFFDTSRSSSAFEVIREKMIEIITVSVREPVRLGFNRLELAAIRVQQLLQSEYVWMFCEFSGFAICNGNEVDDDDEFLIRIRTGLRMVLKNMSPIAFFWRIEWPSGVGLSLMENDMSLLQQLLTLGDQITEMKQLKEQNLRKCQRNV